MKKISSFLLIAIVIVRYILIPRTGVDAVSGATSSSTTSPPKHKTTTTPVVDTTPSTVTPTTTGSGVQTTPTKSAITTTPAIQTPIQAANPVQLTLNNTKVQLKSDIYVLSGQSMIAVREFTELLGAQISWIQKEQTIIISKDSISIELKVGSNKVILTKDGTTQTMTLAANTELRKDKAYVPIRIIAETLGHTVSYDGLTKTINIVPIISSNIQSTSQPIIIDDEGDDD